jgi:hypothetical protein
MQTPLDTALDAARADPDRQLEFYDLFLQSELCFPIHDPDDRMPSGEMESGGESISPWWLEVDEKLTLPAFDTEERLAAWAERPMKIVAMGGGRIVQMLSSHEPPPQIAFNIGCESFHLFVEDELDWLLGHWNAMFPAPEAAGERHMRVGVPDVDFGELERQLCLRLAEMPEVKAAYWLLIEGRVDDVPYEFCVKLDIDDRAHPNVVVSSLSSVMAEYASEDETFIAKAGDAQLLDIARQTGEPPFYVRPNG